MKFGSGSALLKSVAVTVVALVMLIPLGMLRGLVEERTELRGKAQESVARGWGGRQLVSGPVLAVPVSWNSLDDGKIITRDWYLLPDTVNTAISVTVERQPRKLGLYEVPVYVAKIRSRGRFDLARETARLTAGASSLQVHLERARLLVPIGDPRGVRNIEVPGNQIAAGGLEPAQGFPIPALSAPAAAIDATAAAGKREFDIELELAGTQALQVLPLARSMRVDIRGNWPHPGFTSGALPLEHAIDGHGFTARWQMLDLNRAYGARWLAGDVSLETLQQSAFGVDLVQPVDLYQQTSRAVKYAGLFVSLSLLTLFLFEHLVGRALHPIQYGLVGLALSVFYLLLLALAEHIGFISAYIAASAALTVLIGMYLSGVLRNRKAGVAASGIFAAVYALLYLLIRSEDYALLAGALALFTLLATLMVLTRKLDWYRARAGEEPNAHIV